MHAVVIAAVFLAQALADSTLPTLHQPLIFDAPQITTHVNNLKDTTSINAETAELAEQEPQNPRTLELS